MRKTFTDKENKLFKDTQKAWKNKSEKYQKEFERHNDQQIIVKFLSESAHAIKEPWISKEITKAIQQGQGTFLASISSFLKNKRKQKMRDTAILSLSTMLEIDRLVADGKTQQEAFNHLVEKMRHIQPEQGWTFDVVKNRYFRCRKKWLNNKLAEVHIEVENGWTCISAFPTIIALKGRSYAGRWEISMCPGKEDKVSCTLWDFDPESLPDIRVGQIL